MSVSMAQPASPPSRAVRRASGMCSPSELRTLLLAGCVVAAAAALWLGEPAAYLAAEPGLVVLLRSMAAIKACIVVAAVGVLLWRLGHAVPGRTAAAYLVGSWLIAGATTLVWQLSFIPLAAVVFHAGELLLLFTAWRDRGADESRARAPA